MIRLQINIGSTTAKVVVDLIKEQQLNVLDFLKRVTDICQLQDLRPQQLQLYDGQYMLPHLLPSRCILENKTYTVVAERTSKRDAILMKKQQKSKIAKDKKQIKQYIQSISQSSQQEQESSSQIIYQNQKKSLKNVKNNKKQTKTNDQQKTKLNIKRSQQPQQKKHNKNKDMQKINDLQIQNKYQKQIKPAKLRHKFQQIKNDLNANKKRQMPNKNNKQQLDSSDSSESESDSSLPQLSPKNKKQSQNNKILNISLSSKQIKAAGPINKPNLSNKQNLRNGPQSKSKKIINKQQSSEQSSQSSQHKQQSEQQQILQKDYKAKVQQILSNVHSVSKPNLNSKKNEQKFEAPPMKQAERQRNIPISVRNKLSRPMTENSQKQTLQADKSQNKSPKPNLSFKQHQQQKWVPITKQIIKDWQNKYQDIFVQQKNQIRFKIVELDQQKFVPVSSGWIVGYFTKKQSKDGKNFVICMDTATKYGRDDMGNPQYMKNYEIPMHNLQQLQINKNTMNQKQKQQLKIDHNQPPIQKQPQQKVQANKKQVQQEKPSQQKKQQSIQQFICGQIHYYFSDKNYSTDLFMQMHANKDSEKYIPIKLMLNFPKIKKVLTDQNKLWSYLTTDNIYPVRSYELDYGRRMIKKKGLF